MTLYPYRYYLTVSNNVYAKAVKTKYIDIVLILKSHINN